MSRFLALDAGNSSVKAAVWDGAAWSPVARFAYDADARTWAERVAGLAGSAGADGLASGVASVVPAHVEALADGIESATGARPVRVSARLPLPFAVAYRTPETLGADRIAAASAAWHLGGGRPVVALDAGTALTVDAVDVRDGRPVYLGGAIAPGPDLLAASLARGTGALPHVPFGGPTRAVGDSTAEAIRTGIAGLFAGGAERLVRETAAALSAPPLVVATGGVAPWLAARGVRVDAVVPALVLDGVRLLCAPGAGGAGRGGAMGAAGPRRRG